MTNTDLKITISRSFARKVSKNYQTQDYFASYSQEFPTGTTGLEGKSQKLFEMAKRDVEKEIERDYQNSIKNQLNKSVDIETEHDIQEQDINELTTEQ